MSRGGLASAVLKGSSDERAILYVDHCGDICERSYSIPMENYGTAENPIGVTLTLPQCNQNALLLASVWHEQFAPTHRVTGYGCTTAVSKDI